MFKNWIQSCILLSCLCLSPAFVYAQEVVHAQVGTVVSINTSAKTITVKAEDGSIAQYKDASAHPGALEFGKDLRAGTTSAEAFKGVGDKAIVFYFGAENNLTAVGLRQLDTASLAETTGTVAKFDKRKHMLTIVDHAGVETTFRLDAQTVADTSLGAEEGSKLELNEGDTVQVTAITANQSKLAVFIGPQPTN